MTQTLQLSGAENVFLMDDGTLQIFGIKICDTEAELGQGEIVGIQYPPEFVEKLMHFLTYNLTVDPEDTDIENEEFETNRRKDTNKDFGLDDDGMKDWNPDDEDEPDEDPYSPGYNSSE